MATSSDAGRLSNSELSLKLNESTSNHNGNLIQDVAVSSSSDPKTCDSSSEKGKCVETKLTSTTSESRQEIETDLSLFAMKQQVDSLQLSVTHLSCQTSELTSITSLLNDMKKSLDFVVRKIECIDEKLDSLGAETKDRVTQACVIKQLEPPANSAIRSVDYFATSEEFGNNEISQKEGQVFQPESSASIAGSQPASSPTLAGSQSESSPTLSASQAATSSPSGKLDAPCKPITRVSLLTASPVPSPCNAAVIKPLPPKTAEELNKRLLAPLKKVIYKKVKYNDADAKQNMKIMMDTVRSVVAAMRATNPLFDDLFTDTGYTGSYYEGLRVSEANEFDLNLVLQLPIPPEDVELEAADEPGFYRYRLKRELPMILGLHEKWTQDLYHQLIPFFEEGYLLRDKWQNWCQRVLSKSWDKFEKPEGVVKVLPHAGQCGPAITLKIMLESSGCIDVDLVPVLDCPQFSMPVDLQRSERFEKLPFTAQAWFLVPKRLKGDKFTPLEVKRCWRISFPKAEKALLDSLYCVKPLIKLFKLLRDIGCWPIASYFIKSLFLLELDFRSDLECWQEKNMGTRFLEMLEKFQEALKVPFIPYYFNQNANLLSGMPEHTAKPIANRLGRLKTKLTTNPEYVEEMFKLDVDK